MRRKVFKGFSLMTIFTCIFFSIDAFAGLTMHSKWPSNTNINIYTNVSSFNTYKGFNNDYTRNQLINAMYLWNSEAGQTSPLKYAGDTDRKDGNDGYNVICMRPGDNGQNDPYAVCLWWESGSNIIDADIVDHSQYQWTIDYPVGAYSDVFGTNVHELGHVLGLDDITSSQDKTISVMSYNYQMDRACRELSITDINVIRNGAGSVSGYGQKNNRHVKQIYTKDRVNFYTRLDSDGHSNLSPAITYNAIVGYGKYLIAWVSSGTNSNMIWTIRGTGSAWESEASTLGSSKTGVALCWGNGIYIMMWVGSSDTRNLYYSTCSNGSSWSFPVEIPDTPARGRPSITYNSNKGRFVVVWSSRTRDEKTDSMLMSMSSPTASISWTSPKTHNFRVPFGASIACNSNNQCAVDFTEHNGSSKIRNAYGYLDSGNNLVLSGSVLSSETSGSTPGTTYGYDYFTMSFRGRDAANSFNYKDKTSYSGSYANKHTVSKNMFSGPSMVYGTSTFEYASTYVAW